MDLEENCVKNKSVTNEMVFRRVISSKPMGVTKVTFWQGLPQSKNATLENSKEQLIEQKVQLLKCAFMKYCKHIQKGIG